MAVHIYNSSYSGGGDKRILNSKPVWTKLEDSVSNKHTNKKIKGCGFSSSDRILA
jgi:hypothetical protein